MDDLIENYQHLQKQVEFLNEKMINTIALVTDLHEHNPAPVLEIIRDVKPDVITVAGDTLEHHKHGKNAKRFFV